MLQQLAADPADELLASRIVALLQDIPDGEYKVDQLLAAAQMLLGVSPRLGLICAHAAFRSAPDRLESLAIAEEALAKLGRRAKVQVLRQERRKLEAAAMPRVEMNATVSKFLSDEEQERGGFPAIAAQQAPISQVDGDATVVLTSGGELTPDAPQDVEPAWWKKVIGSTELKSDLDAWLGLLPPGLDQRAFLATVIAKADSISKLPDEALLAAVEKISEDIFFARMTGLLVVDAVLSGESLAGEQAHEVATDIMARLLAWHDADSSAIGNAVRSSIGIRLKQLPPSLQDGLARALREQAKAGRPDPTFSTTTL